MTLQLIDRRRARRMIFAVLATAVAATLSAAHAKDDDEEHRGSATYTIGLFGDMPYNALGRSQFPALLADIRSKTSAYRARQRAR